MSVRVHGNLWSAIDMLLFLTASCQIGSWEAGKEKRKEEENAAEAIHALCFFQL